MCFSTDPLELSHFQLFDPSLVIVFLWYVFMLQCFSSLRSEFYNLPIISSVCICRREQMCLENAYRTSALSATSRETVKNWKWGMSIITATEPVK